MPTHVKAVLAGMFVLLVMSFLALSNYEPRPSIIDTIDIGIEHTSTATISLTVTRNDLKRLITLSNEGKGDLHLSVPQDWKRTEVRGMALSAIVSEAPSFGYVRMKIPEKTTISFTAQKPFERLRIQNPSGVLLNVRATSIDLVSNTSNKEVYLVKEGPLLLRD